MNDGLHLLNAHRTEWQLIEASLRELAEISGADVVPVWSGVSNKSFVVQAEITVAGRSTRRYFRTALVNHKPKWWQQWLKH